MLTNLLEFYNDVFNIYDETRAVDVIYLDFQKSFDKVSRKRLIIWEIQKRVEIWFHERKQGFVINGKASNWKNLFSGVPQVSVLGPVPFLT